MKAFKSTPKPFGAETEISEEFRLQKGTGVISWIGFLALRPPQERSSVATSRQGAFDGNVRR
jgi:hypothetical protein